MPSHSLHFISHAGTTLVQKLIMTSLPSYWSQNLTILWPLTPKINRATRPFLKFDIGPSDMRQRGKNYSDMGHSLFLNSTFDMGINTRQGHATFAFLKIDMQNGDPRSKAPHWTLMVKQCIDVQCVFASTA